MVVATTFQRHVDNYSIIASSGAGPIGYRFMDCPIRDVVSELEPMLRDGFCLRVDDVHSSRNLPYEWKLVLC